VDFDRALDLGLGLIRQFEGLILHPYLCSAGVPTIGYGSTYYQDGSRVSLADTPIDKATAEYLLKLTVRKPIFLRLLVFALPWKQKSKQLRYYPGRTI